MIIKARSDVADMIDGTFQSYSFRLEGALRVNAYLRTLRKYDADLEAAYVNVVAEGTGRSCVVRYTASPKPTTVVRGVDISRLEKTCPNCGLVIETRAFAAPFQQPTGTGGFKLRLASGRNDVEYELHLLTCGATK
jgi:hypothetical protein